MKNILDNVNKLLVFDDDNDRSLYILTFFETITNPSILKKRFKIDIDKFFMNQSSSNEKQKNYYNNMFNIGFHYDFFYNEKQFPSEILKKRRNYLRSKSLSDIMDYYDFAFKGGINKELKDQRKKMQKFYTIFKYTKEHVKDKKKWNESPFEAYIKMYEYMRDSQLIHKLNSAFSKMSMNKYYYQINALLWAFNSFHELMFLLTIEFQRMKQSLYSRIYKNVKGFQPIKYYPEGDFKDKNPIKVWKQDANVLATFLNSNLFKGSKNSFIFSMYTNGKYGPLFRNDIPSGYRQTEWYVSCHTRIAVMCIYDKRKFEEETNKLIIRYLEEPSMLDLYKLKNPKQELETMIEDKKIIPNNTTTEELANKKRISEEILLETAIPIGLVILIAPFLIVKLLRVIISGVGKLKIKIINWLKFNADYLDINVLYLQEQMRVAKTDKEREKLQKTIDKQIAWVERLNKFAGAENDVIEDRDNKANQIKTEIKEKAKDNKNKTEIAF